MGGNIMFYFKKKKQEKEFDIDILQQQMYQNSFNKLQDFLPDDWKKVDFHAYYTDSCFGFKYYIMMDNGEWIDCFNLYGKKLTELFLSIDEDITNVRNQLPKKHKWHIMNMIVDNKGHIDVSYDYADKVKDDAKNLMDYLLTEEKEWCGKHQIKTNN